jgi:cytidylate kinase
MTPLSIAIDGPAASGKSTTAREVARRLGLLYVDSGAMYRALALKMMASGIDAEDARAVAALLDSTAIDLQAGAGGTRVILDGQDVTERLRDESVGLLASSIAQKKAVRSYLVARQRELARDRGVVMEGRDIGTVVLPHATVKIFLTASLDVRAERRRKELFARGEPADLNEIRLAIADRDRRDVERAESPLRPAEGAIEVDTTALTIHEQVEEVLAAVGRKPERSGKDVGGPDIQGFYRAVRTIARGLARLLFRLRIDGLEHLPAHGGFILAANHASLIDPPLLGVCATRKLGYLAKEELFRPPGFKHLIEALGAIPIHRRGLDRRGLETAKEVLSSGSGLVLFPEGTRTRSGRLGSARPGVSMLAAEAVVPVVPAHIAGTWRVGRSLLKRPPIAVRFGSPIPPPSRGSGPEWRAEVRDHAERIMDAIAGLGTQVGGQAPPVPRPTPSIREAASQG